MQNYGYSWDGMLPLRQEAAEKLFSQDIEIFRIYENGTEGAVTDHSDLQEHAANGGIFGVEKETWEAFYEYNAMKQELRESEPEKEALLLYGKEDTFGIYQLAHEERTRDLRFELANASSERTSSKATTKFLTFDVICEFSCSVSRCSGVNGEN